MGIYESVYRHFADGLTNVCYNVTGRHVLAGSGDNMAVIWEGPKTGQNPSASFV